MLISNMSEQSPTEPTSPILSIASKAVVFGALVLIGSEAFSWNTRKKIWRRDGGQCQECDGVPCGGRLECAHYDHSRDNPLYDDPSNGRLLCVSKHLEDHELNEGQNGLTRDQNQWAISALITRLGESLKGG